MGSSSFCKFKGSATWLHVQGQGRATLVEPEGFRDGHTKSVSLKGATLVTEAPDPAKGPPNPAGEAPFLVIDRPTPMLPVSMNPVGRPYDVAYTVGQRLIVDVAIGGSPGKYQGPLPTGQPCPPEWCLIIWPTEAKRIEITRDGDAGFAIAASFPLGRDAPGFSPEVSKVFKVEMRGASGELTCGDKVEPIAGAWAWMPQAPGALAIHRPDFDGGIRVENGLLRFQIENDARPQKMAPLPGEATGEVSTSPYPMVAGIAGGAIVLAVASVIVWRRLRDKGPTSSRLRTPPPRSRRPAVPIRVFISHAPEDAEHLDELETLLKPLVDNHRIETFSARSVGAGTDARTAIAENAREADVIVLLVSADYVACDARNQEELVRSLERHRRGEARVIPILVRPCVFAGEWFESIATLPAEAKAVSSFANRDEAWKEIAQDLRKAIKEISSKRPKAAHASSEPANADAQAAP